MTDRKASSAPASCPIEEVAERARRLGITPERVLLEYGHIAFADLSHIIEYGSDGFRIKSLEEMSPADRDAIAEIVPGSDPQHSRVKLYDRKAALDAIARHLGMFPAPPRQREKEGPADPAEDPRAELERRLARLAAAAGQK